MTPATEQPTPAPPAARPRLAFIDIARVLAMYSMVQGHVCDTLLHEAEKATPFFDRYWTFRGLTAPLFFTLSGLAVVIASEKRWDEYLRPGPALTARLRRIGTLMLVGFFMQVPRWYGHPPFDLSRDEWMYMLRCNVLHCVALSLLFAHLLIALCRTRRAFTLVAFSASVLAVVFAPAVTRASLPSWFPTPLALIIRTNEGSLFPVFPWTAHFLIGAVIGRLHLDVPWLRSPRRLGLVVGLLGPVMLVAGSTWRALDPGRMQLPGYWYADPSLLLTRAGGAWLAIGAVALLFGGVTRSPRLLKEVSAHSLSVYVFHLMILWGPPTLPGLIHFLGPKLSIPEAFVAGPVVLAASALAAQGFDALLSSCGRLASRLRERRRPALGSAGGEPLS